MLEDNERETSVNPESRLEFGLFSEITDVCASLFGEIAGVCGISRLLAYAN